MKNIFDFLFGGKDKGKLHGRWYITKYASEADYKAGKVLEKVFAGENCLLNEGINELFTILCSASSGTKFDNSNAYIGVGDNNTAAAASQTGLQAATNKLYKGMEASYPTYGTNQKSTWRSVFGSSDANYAWKEFTVANGNSDSSKNLNRLVSDQGTKASGQVWQVDVEITLS